MNLLLAIQHKLYSLLDATLSPRVPVRGDQPLRQRHPTGAATFPATPVPRVGRLPMGLPLAEQQATARPLRVLRVVEKGQPPATGRLVISGRMADVCAELDRLAAREAAV